jgi:hypothetical protein
MCDLHSCRFRYAYGTLNFLPSEKVNNYFYLIIQNFNLSENTLKLPISKREEIVKIHSFFSNSISLIFTFFTPHFFLHF